MAGIFFTNQSLVLCGYSQHKQRITGIGGKKKKDELPFQTALRETLEELFELQEIPTELIENINKNLVLVNIIGSRSYSTFILSFQDLQIIIDIVNIYKLKSNVYDTIPKNLGELLLNRKVNCNVELSKLLLLPIEESMELDNFFMKDIKVFKNMIMSNSNVF